MGKKKREESSFDPQGYLTTFGDLVTLLLTFFVMLLSMKQPDVLKYSQFFSAFAEGKAGAMSVSGMSRGNQVKSLMERVQLQRPDEVDDQDQQLARELGLPALGKDPLLGVFLQPGLNIRQDPRGAVITIANDLAFASGSAELSPRASGALDRVIKLLRGTTVPISVEGHSDNLPTSASSGYLDNWGLSLARAEAVTRYLVDKGRMNITRFRVAALGDSRPLAPNDSEVNRGRNRRTEIVLLTKE